MPPEDTIVVRFVKAYTVNNGTGVPSGPSYKVGQIERFSTVSGDFWIRTGNAVRATDDEAGRLSVKTGGKFGDGESDGLDDMKSKDLVALAETEKIELGKAQTKAEIIAAIRVARADRTRLPE
jgi:hypothetical protein